MRPLMGTFFIRFGSESIENVLSSYERVNAFESGKDWIRGYESLTAAKAALEDCEKRAGTSIEAQILDSDLRVVVGRKWKFERYN